MNSYKKVDEYGDVYWFKKETKVLHREDGPACEFKNGNKFWYYEGKYHRIDGPACEYINGRKQWFYENKLHRMDGPAVEYANGYKYWYYYGEEINCSSQKEFERLIKLKLFW